MHSLFRRTVTIAIGAAALGACDNSTSGPDTEEPALRPTTISASGDIAARVAEFRTLLGEPSNGGVGGEQPAGRREISWDGAAADPFNNTNDFPAAFFNQFVKSGVVFTTPGTGFRNDSLAFTEVNATYAEQFDAFSPTKIFSPVGVNVMDVIFQVAGQPTPATVTGFGAVFSDVDVAGRTTIEFFDANGGTLGTIAAPVRSDASGFSFVGAAFPQPLVARVRITLGTGALGAAVNDISAGGTLDLVVADNFIFGEPKAIR